MISTTQHHRATANPSEHRASPRWRIQDGLSQIAQSTADDALGLLVDIGIGGFQISLLQPLPSVESQELLLILDRYPDAPQTINVTATPTWIDETSTTGIGYAGFRIDDLKPRVAISILRHIAACESDYSVVQAPRETQILAA